MNEAVIPLDLPKFQKPLTSLRETILNVANPFQAIAHTLFQTSSNTTRPLSAGRIPLTAEPEASFSMQTTSTPQRLPTSARLTDETPVEENLRENVVETWLRQQSETGRRPTISFVEAHKLYRDLYEEFVSTATVPPDQFAQAFLQTPPNLTLDQAKTELHARLNAGLTHENERGTLKTQTESKAPIPSILAPSFIATTLWAKGSLAFGASPQLTSSPILRVVPDRSESSASRSSLTSEEKQSNLDSNLLNQLGTNNAQVGASSTDTQVPKFPGEQGTGDKGRNLGGQVTQESTDPQTGLPTATLERSEQASPTYSPAAALYSTLAAHATTAFISPTQGNGHTSPTTIHTSILKPPFAIIRDLKTITFTGISPKLAPQHEEPVIERLERILPIVESHPTPIYLRPPMNLPAVASTTPQRNPALTLPSSSIASTRENISKQDLDEEDEASDENGGSEGYPEIEDDSEDAAMREQVKRMGKILAEEARRHIGST